MTLWKQKSWIIWICQCYWELNVICLTAYIKHLLTSFSRKSGCRVYWDWFDVVEGKQTSLESSAWEYCDRCTEWSPRLLRSVNCCRKLQRTNEFSFLHNHTDSQKIWLYLGFLCPKEYLYCDFYIIFLFCIFRGSFYFPDCLAKLNIDKVYYYNFNKLSKIFEECFKL